MVEIHGDFTEDLICGSSFLHSHIFYLRSYFTENVTDGMPLFKALTTKQQKMLCCENGGT